MGLALQSSRASEPSSLALGSAAGYVDVGNGWFLAVDDDWSTDDGHDPVAFLADSRATGPDVRFGPDAWGGLDGPPSGLTLLHVEGLGYSECRSYSSGDVPGQAFPGVARVGIFGRMEGLEPLDGREFDSVDSFVAALRECRQMDPATTILSCDRSEREAAPSGAATARKVQVPFVSTAFPTWTSPA